MSVDWFIPVEVALSRLQDKHPQFLTTISFENLEHPKSLFNAIHSKIIELESGLDPDQAQSEVLSQFTKQDIPKLVNDLREFCSQWYIVPQQFRTEWIQSSYAEANTPSEKRDLLGLFKRLYSELRTRNLGKMYSTFVIELYKQKEIEQLNYRRVFDILEEILTIFGLDFDESGAFYSDFTNFCKLVLEQENITVQREKEVKAKLYSLYKRRLTFPQSDLESAYQQFKKEAEEYGFEKETVRKRYEESKKAMKNFKVHHSHFQRALHNYEKTLKDKELISFFKNNFSSIHKNNLNYLKLYYERALDLNVANSEIWDLYLKDLELTVKQFKGVKQETYQKAIKANPSFSQYWLALMLHHQSENASTSVIQGIELIILDFFKVASGCAGDPEEQFALMRYFTLYFVRKLQSTNIDENDEAVQDVRENFDQALQNLEQNPELQHKMAKLAAEVEFHHFYQKVKKEGTGQRIKNCMELVVRSKEGNTQENWIFFGRLFIAMGDIKEARRVFTRALNYCSSEKTEIISEWVKMEQIQGTAESLLQAQSKIKQKGANIEPVQQEEKKEVGFQNKRRQAEAMKRSKNIAKVKHSLYFKNLPEQLTEEQLSDIIKTTLSEQEHDKYEVRIVRTVLGVSKGYAFVDFEEKESAEKALVLHNMELEGRKCSVQFSKPPSKGENDYRTVFVNNLSFQTSEEDLEGLFGEYGQITEVRLIKDDRGKAKGFAYVEFSSEQEADEAVSKMDKQRISGRVLSVMKANSMRKEKQESERTVHISNIPYEASETQIEEQFAKFGVISKLYLPRKEEGAGIRGFAFVEYENEEAAKRAVRVKTIELLGRGVLIRKSTRKITVRDQKDEFLPPLPVKQVVSEVNRRKKVEVASTKSGVKKEVAKKEEKSNEAFANSLFS